MLYSELIEIARNYSRIVVVGPQRSGTTFTAFSIANSIGYDHYDEFDPRISMKSFDEIIKIVQENENLVVQKPTFTHRIHQIEIPSLLFVYMKRSLEDTQRSIDRVKWKFDNLEITKFKQSGFDFDENEKMSAIVKNHVFATQQKQMMKCPWVFFEYENLKDAPGYKEPSERSNFNIKQIR